MTISSGLNFGGPAPPGRGSAVGGGEFGSALLQLSRTLCDYGGLRRARSVCVSLSAFFIISLAEVADRSYRAIAHLNLSISINHSVSQSKPVEEIAIKTKKTTRNYELL